MGNGESDGVGLVLLSFCLNYDTSAALSTSFLINVIIPLLVLSPTIIKLKSYDQSSKIS
jgi:hypothetical protein